MRARIERRRFDPTPEGPPAPTRSPCASDRPTTLPARRTDTRQPPPVLRCTTSTPRLTIRADPPILNLVVKSQTLDRTLNAVADPMRRDILEHLGRGPASISELAQPLGISLPGLMKHVRILEGAHLVETRKNGRTRECRLGPARMDDVSDWIESYRKRWDVRLDRLETYLVRKKEGQK
jgi:DNA-binding transcriptional ArsR family regulator